MKKQYKIFGLILALALLVCSVVALSASAEDSLAIEYANVAYNKMTQLAFTIKGTPAEGAEVGLAYWGYDVTAEKTIDNATVTFESGVLEGKTYWLTPGIPASKMSSKITIAPVTKDANGNVAIAGALFEYSIYDYVNDRLSDDNVTDAQMKLYTNLVKYGNSAEKIINKTNPTIPYVIAENGEMLATGKSFALVSAGDKFVLRANTINADGNYFLYWAASDGSKIYDRIANVTAGAANATYTATYGDKAESAYGGSLNLNALTVGTYNVITGTPAIKNSGDIYYVVGDVSHFNGAVSTHSFAKVTSATDSTPIASDKFSVKEENGNKYISYEKNFILSGITGARVVLNNPDTKVENRIDIEMRINSTGWLGMDWHLYFTDGASNKEKHPSAEVTSDGTFKIAGVIAGKIKRGETFTLTLQIVEAGVEFYFNGNYVTTVASGQTSDYNNAAKFRGFGMTGNSGCDFDVDFFTVNFVNTNMFN